MNKVRWIVKTPLAVGGWYELCSANTPAEVAALLQGLLAADRDKPREVLIVREVYFEQQD